MGIHANKTPLPTCRQRTLQSEQPAQPSAAGLMPHSHTATASVTWEKNHHLCSLHPVQIHVPFSQITRNDFIWLLCKTWMVHFHFTLLLFIFGSFQVFFKNVIFAQQEPNTCIPVFIFRYTYIQPRTHSCTYGYMHSHRIFCNFIYLSFAFQDEYFRTRSHIHMVRAGDFFSCTK